MHTTVEPKIEVLINLFILFVHDHSTKYYGPHWFSFIICTRLFDQIIWSSFIYSFCVRPFDVKLGSSLIYLFHLRTTIKRKYVVLIHLFFLSAQPFDQKPGSTLIYFFYLYTTIQQKYVVLFHLFLLLCTIIRPKVRVLIDFFIICTWPVGQTMRSSFIHSFCARPFDLKLGSSLIYFFHLHTTIRQKYMIVFHLFFLCAQPFDQKSGSSLVHFFLFVHDHSTKVK